MKEAIPAVHKLTPMGRTLRPSCAVPNQYLRGDANYIHVEIQMSNYIFRPILQLQGPGQTRNIRFEAERLRVGTFVARCDNETGSIVKAI